MPWETESKPVEETGYLHFHFDKATGKWYPCHILNCPKLIEPGANSEDTLRRMATESKCPLCGEPFEPEIGARICEACLEREAEATDKALREHEKERKRIEDRGGFVPDIERMKAAKPLESEYEKLEHQAAELEARMEALSSAIETREAMIGHDEHYPEETHLLFEMNHEPGTMGAHILDEAVARSTPCHKFTLPSGKHLVFSKGAIGPLDDGQQALYCPETVDVPLTEGQKKRFDAFTQAVETCQVEIQPIPKGERLGPWLRCMSREAKAKGVEI